MKMIYLTFSLDHEMLPSMLYQLEETAHTNVRANAWTDGQTQTDRLWYEINVPFFLHEKAGIKSLFYEYVFNIQTGNR